MQPGDERHDQSGSTAAEKPGSGPGQGDENPESDAFAFDVLAALADMAMRSKRRQADLDAALRRAGMDSAGHTRRHAALNRLQQLGCIDKVVELTDGGVLLSVTALGLDRLGPRR